MKRPRDTAQITEFNISPNHGVLPKMLDEGCLCDITIKCEDDFEIRAHRVVLAAASDVLKAKFTTALSDAHDKVWSPEIGSSRAWRWLLSWIYAQSKPLPSDHLVELVIIADMFNFRGLVESINALNVEDISQSVACQVLLAPAVPKAVDNIASKCIPLASMDLAVWDLLKKAPVPNAALFMKYIEGVSEVDRLSVLGALCLQKTPTRRFPACFIECVQWHLFPVCDLKAGLSGNFSFCGTQPFPDILQIDDALAKPLHNSIVNALVQRCENLERSCQIKSSRFDRVPTPEAPAPGIFKSMVETGQKICISLSSSHRDNVFSAFSAHPLLELDTTRYGTDKSHAAEATWIELKAPADITIHPDAVGLKHGWSESDYCESFVIEAYEANSNGGSWIELLSSDKRLTSTGKIYPVCKSDIKGKHFSRIRIRMTGNNSTGKSYLMVGWFDVFGDVRRADWNAIIQKHLA